MSRSDLVRISLGLLVAIALTLPPALPAPAAAAEGGAAAAAVWSGEAFLDAFLGLLSRLWAKEGPDLDPNGNPQGSAAPAPGPDKAGSSIDPNGNPGGTAAGPGVSDQAGPDIDPNGQP